MIACDWATILFLVGGTTVHAPVSVVKDSDEECGQGRGEGYGCVEGDSTAGSELENAAGWCWTVDINELLLTLNSI